MNNNFERRCGWCNKLLPKDSNIRQHFCNPKCSRNLWIKNNYEHYKQLERESARRYRTNHRKRFNNNQNKEMKRNRLKHRIRCSTAYYRNDIYAINGDKCCKCGSQSNLTLHHLSYDLKGKTMKEKIFKNLDKILVICQDCHVKLGSGVWNYGSCG
jgi:hypothetical protein